MMPLILWKAVTLVTKAYYECLPKETKDDTVLAVPFIGRGIEALPHASVT